VAKKLEDLDGMDEPLARGETYRPDEPVDDFLEELREMEDTPRYHFAWGTVIGILKDVERTGRATAGQRQAIQNIKAGAQRHEDAQEGWERHERRTGRRYEGFDDPYRKG
jgi:hypothetical protein